MQWAVKQAPCLFEKNNRSQAENADISLNDEYVKKADYIRQAVLEEELSGQSV